MKLIWFLVFLKGAFAASPAVKIPEIKNPRHEIGFACLKDIQTTGSNGAPGTTCGQPFKKFSSIGELLPEEFAVPNWAKKSNGDVLTRADWEKIESVMTGYDEGYGYKVYGVREDAIELKLPLEEKLESIWISRARVAAFYSLAEYGICEIAGDKWWMELKKEDLKTLSGLELDKKIPGDLFKGLEPLGVLETRRNEKLMLCQVDSCVDGKVKVDPKYFQKDEISLTKGSVKSLNLGAEHFLGVSDAKLPLKTDHLVVFDQKGRLEFLLQADIYDRPKIWVKLSESQLKGVQFLAREDAAAKRVWAALGANLTFFSDALLKQTGLTVTGHKWQEGQLWYKVKVHATSRCSGELDELSLGEFWLPYSSRLQSCPKGC